MVNNWIEEHFPKSAAYINKVFEKKGRELGKHYDFIAGRYIYNVVEPDVKLMTYFITSRRKRNRIEKELHEEHDEQLLEQLKSMNKWHNHNI